MTLKKIFLRIVAGGMMMFTMAMSVFAENTGGAEDATGGVGGLLNNQWFSFLLIPVVLVLMYFLLIRPQRKRDKEASKMRSSIEIGDEIVTIGGIIGRVVNIKEDGDIITIETGSDKTKVRIRKWAIQDRITVKGD